MTDKTLYKIVLNWYGQSFTFYRYARIERAALLCAIHALAEEVERSHSSVRNYFLSDVKDNYLVQKAKPKGGNNESKTRTRLSL